MTQTSRSRPVLVIGGGVIGLAIARRLARSGSRVTLFEKGEPGREASSAAAGILAPQLEFEEGSPLLPLGLESRAMFPDLARELEEETGIGIDLRLNGALAVDTSGSGPRPGGRTVSGTELREMEPALADTWEAAHFYQLAGSVDPRALVLALTRSCVEHGVEVRSAAAVEEVLVSRGRVEGIRVGGETIAAGVVIHCAGAWAAQVRVPELELAVRPIKGQMALLSTRGTAIEGPRRVIYSHHAYLVPRSDGRIIVGTTVEDRGFDKAVEAGALARLLQGAATLCPTLAGACFVEAWAGLRPLGSSQEPLVGPAGPEGFFVAVGHYRNGILLAPLTALRLAAAVLKR